MSTSTRALDVGARHLLEDQVVQGRVREHQPGARVARRHQGRQGPMRPGTGAGRWGGPATPGPGLPRRRQRPAAGRRRGRVPSPQKAWPPVLFALAAGGRPVVTGVAAQVVTADPLDRHGAPGGQAAWAAARAARPPRPRGRPSGRWSGAHSRGRQPVEHGNGGRRGPRTGPGRPCTWQTRPWSWRAGRRAGQRMMVKHAARSWCSW